jgi:acyl-CoA reductase-like NAD-dependent aldehyde dehydrogenase
VDVTDLTAQFDRWRSPSAGAASGVSHFATVSPVTGETLGRYPAHSAADARHVVERASAAQAEWAAGGFVARRRALLRAADILEERVGDLRAVFALETGGIAGWAEMNVLEAAATLREAAAVASSPIGELLPSTDPRTLNQSRRGPAGVVLAIVPWNAPLILAARASAIALVMGNAVVLRPSESSPMTAGFVLAEALEAAGLPSDVVSVVTTAPGDGRTAITEMIEHPAVRRVVFIGSTTVGRRIGETAGRALVPAVLELGGKNATIVRGDADLDLVVPQLAFSAFANTGQVCMCTDRVVVDRAVASEVTERLAVAAASIVVGDPRRDSTQMGPLINDAAADQFAMFVDDARSAGARVVTGGDRDGRYATPTVLADLPASASYYAEEGFSPVVSVHPVGGDDEAVAVANEGDYGLIGAVFSRDTGAATRVAARMRAGAVHVNGPSVGDEPHVPFGGIGASGLGRLGGAESVRFFTEQRTTYLHGES